MRARGALRIADRQKAIAEVPKFAQRFAAYRHYQLEGWVVRLDSLKFGADLLLYEGPPSEVTANELLVLECKGSVLWAGASENETSTV